MTSTNATLNIQDVPRLLSKYWPSIVTATVLSTVIFTYAAFRMPHKYKAHFVLTIYSKYFQSPLVDFIPELGESGEMRSQRESLIRAILTPEYLDYLGLKYGIYATAKPTTGISTWQTRLKAWERKIGLSQPASKESQMSAEREDLRNRIDIYSMGSTTFNVGFVYSNPTVTYQVTQDIYTQLIHNLLDVRMRILSNVRDAIQRRVDSLSANLNAPAAPAPPPPVSSGPQLIQKELDSVREQLRVMTSEYTEEHPLVIQLREREKMLVNRLADAWAASPAQPLEQPARQLKSTLDGSPGETVRELYGDLMRKLNYVNIAIDSDSDHQGDYFATLEPAQYPSSPLWPKKGLMAAWGFALGLFGSLFIAALREYFERSTIHAENLAHHLGIPVLGQLPPFPAKASLSTMSSHR